MEKYFGSYRFTENLQKKIIKESGLPISYGLATNKLISKVATNEVKPNGHVQIALGNEKSFLAPLSINKMPGVGEKTGVLLKQMGISIIKTLSEIPVEMLNTMFGKSGTEMWRRANGIDETPVVPFHEQKSISTENTFQSDTIDMAFMKASLVKMTEQIAFELRSQNRLTGCVTVKLRYSSFDTFTKQKSIPYSAHDHTLLKYVEDLFEKLYDRRLLVRMIGVRFTNLIPGNYQINLFEDKEEDIKLYQSIDSIKFRFGKSLIMRASGMIK